MSHHSDRTHKSGGSRDPRITVRDPWYEELGQDRTGSIMGVSDMSDAWDEEERNHVLQPPSIAGNSAYSGLNRLRVGDTLTGVNDRLGGSQTSAPAYQQSYHYSTPSVSTEHRSRNSRDLRRDFDPPAHTRGSATPSPSVYDPTALQGIGQGASPYAPPYYPPPDYIPNPNPQRRGLPFLDVPTRGHPDNRFWASSNRRPSQGSGSNSSSDYEHDRYGRRVYRKKGKKRPASSNVSYKQERDDRHGGRGGEGSRHGGYA